MLSQMETITVDTSTSVKLEPSLKNYLQQLDQCAIVYDSRARIVFANDASYTQLPGLLTKDNAHPTRFNETALNEIVHEVLKTGKRSESIEITIETPLGDVRYKIVDCVPWLDASNKLSGCICNARDVTDARRKEFELAESRNLLQLVLEHMPVRVFWKDRDLAYLGCNTVFANDMGFERPEELIGQDDFATSMTHEEAQLCRADDFQVLASLEGCYGTEEVIGSGNEKSWIRVSKVPLHGANGDLLGVLGLYEGIDEQKQAQFELENALRRERELNELKSKFISTVSHEYRNPLATILATTDALIYIGDRFDEPKRRKRLEAIKDAVKRMTLLMDDVLFIGREGLMNADQTHEAIALKALCDSAVAAIASDVGDTSRIEINEHGTPFPIIGLPSQLKQLIQNVLVNGLKYSEDAVILDLTWKDDCVALSVQDKGIGIPDADQQRVFESFFRGENIGMVAGSGLGLYIAQRVVELHNGQMEIESELGNGTTVSVQLPYKPRSF